MRSLITLKALTYAPTRGHRGRGRRPRCPSPRRRAELGLPLLLAARCHVHALRPPHGWLRRGSARLARVAPAGRRRRRRRSCTSCMAWRRAAADRDGSRVAAGLRELQAGADRQRGPRAVSARRVRRGHGRARIRPARGLETWTTTPGTASARCSTSWRRRGNEPDEGIWEVRGPRRHFTHSKVMAWVALDRAIKATEQFNLRPVSIAGGRSRGEIHERGLPRRVRREAQLVRAVLRREGARRQLADDPARRLPAAHGRARARHGRGDRKAPRARRLRDALRYDRRATTACRRARAPFSPARSGWPTTTHLLGQHDKARELFDRLAGLCNDVGLLSEEYDPKTKRLVGNFPQAFSHVGLVNTALNLSQPSHGPTHQRKDA